jgi:hypothetical protein
MNVLLDFNTALAITKTAVQNRLIIAADGVPVDLNDEPIELSILDSLSFLDMILNESIVAMTEQTFEDPMSAELRHHQEMYQSINRFRLQFMYDNNLIPNIETDEKYVDQFDQLDEDGSQPSTNQTIILCCIYGIMLDGDRPIDINAVPVSDAILQRLHCMTKHMQKIIKNIANNAHVDGKEQYCAMRQHIDKFLRENNLIPSLIIDDETYEILVDPLREILRRRYQ